MSEEPKRINPFRAVGSTPSRDSKPKTKSEAFTESNDPLDYSLEKFYLRSVNDHDNSVVRQVKYAPHYQAELQRAIEDPTTEWRSEADVFRDALAHRLQWWRTTTREMTPRTGNMMREAEEERFAFAEDVKDKVLKRYEANARTWHEQSNYPALQACVRRMWAHADERQEDDPWFAERLNALGDDYAKKARITRED